MATVVPSRSSHSSSMSENAAKPSLTWCQPCGERLIELKRQALKFLMIEYHKVVMIGPITPSHIGPLFYSVYEQLRLPDFLRTGIGKEQCDSCGTCVETLKRQAVHALQSVNIAPFLPRSVMYPTAPATQGMPSVNAKWHNMHSGGVPTGPVINNASADSPNKTLGSKQEMICNNVSVEEARRHRRLAEEVEDGADIPAAALFFAKAAQKFNIPTKKKTKRTVSRVLSRDSSRTHYDTPEEREGQSLFPTNFSDLVELTPPPKPPGLFKYMGRRVDGKVKVMLRVAPDADNDEKCTHLRVDQRRRQVTVVEPKSLREEGIRSHALGPSPPKMFAFDAIFEPSASQHEITSTALLDVLHAVINGGDGSLIVYGAGNTGKTSTMVGEDDSVKTLGAIPCAITWLYNLIEDSKQRTGARFSVRVSAVEIVGKSENLKDLLAEQASGGSSTSSSGTSPGIYLREDPICGVQLSNVSELRAPTADKAAFYLDAALAARTGVPAESNDAIDITEYQGSHMIYTLHVYQYRIDRGSRSEVHGGRSRLYLIDLSAWERGAFRDCLSHSAPSQGSLGAVIVAMLNGMKQYPCRDSKITRLLKDSIGNMACRTTVVAHVSSDRERISETLGTVQMAAKIHRSRRKRNKLSANNSSNESSCDEKLGRRRPTPAAVLTYGIDDNGILDASTSDYTSSAGEESCDTVIYVGDNGRGSDIDFTDNEGPPDFLKERHGIEEEVRVLQDDNHNIVEVPRKSSLNRPGSSTAPSPVSQRLLTPSTLERMRAEALSLEKIDVQVPDHPVHPTTSSPDFLPQVSSYEGKRTSIPPICAEEWQPVNDVVQSRVISADFKKGETVKGGVEDNIFGRAEKWRNGDLKEYVLPMHDKNPRCPVEQSDQEAITVYVGETALATQEDEDEDEPVSPNAYPERKPAIVHSQFQPLESQGDLIADEEEESSYTRETSISEKELRKKERRLKKLLKEKLKHHKAMKRGESKEARPQRTENDIGCFSDQEQGPKRSSHERRAVDHEGYFSAPETYYYPLSPESDSNQGINKFWRIDFGNSSLASTSSGKGSEEENTKNVLENYVAVNLEEKRLSSSASDDSHSLSRSVVVTPDAQLVVATVEEHTPEVTLEPPSSPVVPCIAHVQYVKTNTASITSTRTYKGSMLSLSSETGAICSGSLRVRSDSKTCDAQGNVSEDSISVMSETDSTLSGEIVHRRRGPPKICYRWSTVYEEEEKAKHSKNKASKGACANASSEVSPGKVASPKGKTKKVKEPKGSKKVEKIASTEVAFPESKEPSNTKKTLPTLAPPLSPLLNGRCSLSMCSDSSSGIVSNAASNLSEQSFAESSTTASPVREKGVFRPEEQEPFSPRTRRWFFGRERKGKGRHHSGYVSDGSLTDSSRASWRSRGLFGSKSRLSSHGHSSGYESMRTDGGVTSNASGNESSGEGGSTKRKKRRFLGFRRRSTSDLTRKGRGKGSYWIDNAAIFSDNEDIEYKLYNVEDIDGVIPAPRARSDSDPAGGHDGKQARLLETHRRRVAELRHEREKLAAELDQAMEKLMLDKNRYKVAGSVRSNPDHPHYANELEREVGLFHRRLRVLKAHLEMITCFDRLKFHRCTSL